MSKGLGGVLGGALRQKGGAPKSRRAVMSNRAAANSKTRTYNTSYVTLFSSTIVFHPWLTSKSRSYHCAGSRPRSSGHIGGVTMDTEDPGYTCTQCTHVSNVHMYTCIKCITSITCNTSITCIASITCTHHNGHQGPRIQGGSFLRTKHVSRSQSSFSMTTLW